MESRLEKLYQVEFDIEKLLEMNDPPFDFIDTKIAQLQSFVEEIGTAYSEIKIEWNRRLELVKNRYDQVKNGGPPVLPNPAVIEKELFDLQFSIQTLMGGQSPQIEEIDVKLAKFIEAMAKIPTQFLDLTKKWNDCHLILMNDYNLLSVKKQFNNNPQKPNYSHNQQQQSGGYSGNSAQKDSNYDANNNPNPQVKFDDWGSAPTGNAPQQSNDWGSASAGGNQPQKQSSDWGCSPDGDSFASKNSDYSGNQMKPIYRETLAQRKVHLSGDSEQAQKQSDDWGNALPTGNSAPKPSFGNPKPPQQQSNFDDWGSAPYNTSAPAQSYNGNQSSKPDAYPKPAHQQSDDWGSVPSGGSSIQKPQQTNYSDNSAPQQSNYGGNQPQKQSDDGGCGPNGDISAQKHSDYGGNSNPPLQEENFNDWGSAPTSGNTSAPKQSNDNQQKSNYSDNQQQQSGGYSGNSAQKDYNNNPKPQVDFDDWGSTPTGNAPQQSNYRSNQPQKQSDDWGSAPAGGNSAPQQSNYGGNQNPPQQTSNFDDWGSAPSGGNDHQQQQQAKDRGGSNYGGNGNQQHGNEWDNSNYGADQGQGGGNYGGNQGYQGGQDQGANYGADQGQGGGNYGGNQGYQGGQDQGANYGGGYGQENRQQHPNRNIDEDPATAAIREEISNKIEAGFARFNPVSKANDLKGLKILFQKTSRARKLIDVFRGNRYQLLADTFTVAVSKLPEDLQSQCDQEQKSLNGLLQFLNQTLKDLAELKSREEPEDEMEKELARCFTCSFCKVEGHNNSRCPIIGAMLCNNCLRYGHTLKRCANESLEPEQITGI